jgi:calcium-translocating P-type ATPase
MDITRLSAAEVLASLGSSEAGLDAADVTRRRVEFGPNRLEELRGPPRWRLLLRQFTHFFALILWVAAILAFAADFASADNDLWRLGVAIVCVILINGVFSFVQEYRAERAIAALRELLPASTRTLRAGELLTVPADDLVPGDVVLLAEGDQVPADCRVLQASALRADFATLTGESKPLTRTADPVDAQPSLEARNLLFAGTSIVSGRCRAVVHATGMHTEFGRIAHLTQMAVERESPLQVEIARLSRLIAMLAAALGLAFFGIGLVMGLPAWLSAMFAIGIIVANVPEGLLPTVTLSLAMATQRMARRNALVRHLPAVETLGATSVICSDKTGTLTQNRMSVRAVFIARLGAVTSEPEQLAAEEHLPRNMRLCHDLRRGRRDGQDIWLGDPMERALAEFGRRSGAGGDERVVDDMPFDSDRRCMSVVVEHDKRRWLYCKGAPEAVMHRCSAIEAAAGAVPLDEGRRASVEHAQHEMTARGLRVLAFACRALTFKQVPVEASLTLSGLVGLDDPPRPEVPDAITRCRSAGIRVVMLTGDHPETALAIAREIGLVRSSEPRVVQGERMQHWTDAQLSVELDAPEVLFTRVTPEQKTRVVRALQSKGHVVAVTGDGVNDAPALKVADIGVAMGVGGTDVAKEAADMVLLDDNFATIVNAVEEGRAVYQNVRKFLTYILTSNVPELVPYLGFVLFRIPLPLTIMQILAVDLGTDMLPALALGAERPDGSLMQEPPRSPSERLLSWPLLVRAYFWLGILQAAAALSAFFYMLHLGGWRYGETLAPTDPLYLQATTACMSAIVLAQVVNVFACRHPRRSMFSPGPGTNRLLLAGVAAEIALLLLIVFTPAGQAAFGTAPVPVSVWLVMVGLALAFGAAEELRKALLRRTGKPLRSVPPGPRLGRGAGGHA